jgi:hypothetical protein
MSLIIEAFCVLVLTLLNKALCHSQSCSASCGAGSPTGKSSLRGQIRRSLSLSLWLMQKKRDQPHSEEAFGKIPICYLRMTFDKIGGRCDRILFPSSSFKEKLILQLAIFFLLQRDEMPQSYLGECVRNFAMSFAFA